MDYLCIDLSSLPIRALRATVAKSHLAVLDYAVGPTDKEEEVDWLKRWTKRQKHPLRRTTLFALWDHPDMCVKVRPHLFHPANAPAPPPKRRSDNTASPLHDLSDTRDLLFTCPLPPVHAEASQIDYALDLTVQVPREKRDRLVRLLFECEGGCNKLSVMPLSLWAAFLMSYPNYHHMTVAAIWASPDRLAVIVVDRGKLSFYRQFPCATANAELWVTCIKECLEQFSFTFPWATIDLMLLGGDLSQPDMTKEWIESVSGCPCEIVSPFHEGHVALNPRNRHTEDAHLLTTYWPAMGLIYGNHYPWETLYPTGAP